MEVGPRACAERRETEASAVDSWVQGVMGVGDVWQHPQDEDRVRKYGSPPTGSQAGPEGRTSPMW